MGRLIDFIEDHPAPVLGAVLPALGLITQGAPIVSTLIAAAVLSAILLLVGG